MLISFKTYPFSWESNVTVHFAAWQGFLPNELQIFGYARSNLTNEELHKKLRG